MLRHPYNNPEFVIGGHSDVGEVVMNGITNLLSKRNLHPVLVDIGSIGGAPGIWHRIAQHSIYIGFDPNLESVENTSGIFYRRVTFNKVVTADKEANEVPFYFTKSPYNCSTLRPNPESDIRNFLYSDGFTVESETKIPATSLDSVMDGLSLSRLHWLKVDSQGTDLRLYSSLKDSLRNGVLAIDIEPTLHDAYIGEDLFVEAHTALTKQGFWLSDLRAEGAVRMKRSALSSMIAANEHVNLKLIESLKRSPTFVNARYLRTIDWLTQGKFDSSDYVLLWVFSVLDNNLSFALEVAFEYQHVFGSDHASQLMQTETISRIRHLANLKSLSKLVLRLTPQALKKPARNLLESVM